MSTKEFTVKRYHKNKLDFVVIVVQKIFTVDVVFASFYKPRLTVIRRTDRQINSYSYRCTILKYYLNKASDVQLEPTRNN